MRVVVLSEGGLSLLKPPSLTDPLVLPAAIRHAIFFKGQRDGHHAKRKFASDARASPALMSGTITNSSVLTPGSSTA